MNELLIEFLKKILEFFLGIFIVIYEILKGVILFILETLEDVFEFFKKIPWFFISMLELIMVFVRGVVLFSFFVAKIFIAIFFIVFLVMIAFSSGDIALRDLIAYSVVCFIMFFAAFLMYIYYKNQNECDHKWEHEKDITKREWMVGGYGSFRLFQDVSVGSVYRCKLCGKQKETYPDPDKAENSN